MKAAVLHQLGNLPKYEEYPTPIPQNDEQLIITVKASAIKNLDKLRASGKHYASYTDLPAIVGIDGVGLLENGTRVYAQGITGMIAEKALISKNSYTVLPDKIDDLTAAALPNAVIGATMALRTRAEMKKGDVVLINGATGVTGQIAVQIAKLDGASRIVVTGRNAESLERLKALGADVIVSLKQNDESIISQLKEIHRDTPVNIVIDYLWGHPVELIINSLKGGGLHNTTSKVRLVTVGSMAGENINLSSGTLRSSAIEILGSGIGSIAEKDMQRFNTEILPDMFKLAAAGKLTIETEKASLKDIETLWNYVPAPGKRLVVCS
ncbi:MAG: zinc-binding alcohol dehydrogenase family protein [Bacteroidota bacterium]|nr:zinc-binding alcohol dehydrogenase family protein [Bacteroidota bacterium]